MKVVSVVDITTPGATAPGVTPDPKTVNPITLLTNRKTALEQIDKACKRYIFYLFYLKAFLCHGPLFCPSIQNFLFL